MSLLDALLKADGAPSASYLKGNGRTVVRVRRVSFRTPSMEKPKPSFRLDGEVLKSTDTSIQALVGTTVTAQLNFNYPDKDFARMRRGLSSLATVTDGEPVSEEAAAHRNEEFCGSAQAGTGAIITIVTVTKPQTKDKTKDFTAYEFEVPSEADLDGLDL